MQAGRDRVLGLRQVDLRREPDPIPQDPEHGHDALDGELDLRMPGRQLDLHPSPPLPLESPRVVAVRLHREDLGRLQVDPRAAGPVVDARHDRRDRLEPDHDGGPSQLRPRSAERVAIVRPPAFREDLDPVEPAAHEPGNPRCRWIDLGGLRRPGVPRPGPVVLDPILVLHEDVGESQLSARLRRAAAPPYGLRTCEPERRLLEQPRLGIHPREQVVQPGVRGKRRRAGRGGG